MKSEKTFEKVVDDGKGEIPQVRRIYNKETGEKQEKMQYFSWKEETKCQRKVLYKSQYMETVPWGFNEK